MASDKVGGPETIPTRLLPTTELKAVTVTTATKTGVKALPALRNSRPVSNRSLISSGPLANLFTHFYTPLSVRFHQERYDSNRFLNVPA